MTWITSWDQRVKPDYYESGDGMCVCEDGCKCVSFDYKPAVRYVDFVHPGGEEELVGVTKDGSTISCACSWGCVCASQGRWEDADGVCPGDW